MDRSMRRREGAFLGALALVLVLLQSTGLGRPFLRQHESNGAEFGKHARNHLKFGLGATRGLMLDVSGPRLEAYEDYRKHFYSNHPPLSALLLAGAFAGFGVHEAVFRGLYILVSVAALVLFRLVAGRLLQPLHARLACVFFALCPAFVFYSIVTGLQVLALVGILAAFLGYLRWTETGRRRDYAGILGGIGLACASSWEGYYAAPAIVAAHLWAGRPRRGAVFALLGLNLALFGIALLHLAWADPSGLAPLRSLLGAGLDRSSMHLPSLPAYLAGEAKELALMFTLPVLGLAGAWVCRGPREPSDGLVAGSAFLGLHEVVFAALASRHEYYSYGLVVFLSLAAAAALAKFKAGRAACAVAVAVFLAQAGWVLSGRLTREGGYVFYQRLGLAIGRVLAPDEHVLVLTDHLPFYTAFYGDRRMTWYDAKERRLLDENTGPRREGVGEEEVLDLVRLNPGTFDWVVTAEKGPVTAEIPWMRDLDDAQLESFGVETRRTPRREVLERRCGAPLAEGGFLFWRLPRR